MLSTVVYNLAQKNVAPIAFRTSNIITQYMTKFAMDQVCVQPGLNVSITVWQLPSDKFFIPRETGVNHEAGDPQV